MNSMSWPKIFNGNSSNIEVDDKATSVCISLLLGSEEGTLFGDPDFGLRLKRYTFNQNNYILKDILIDEIYTKIRTFCPQVYLERKNIEIKQEHEKLIARISCQNRKNFAINTYELVLFDNDEEE